MSNLTNGSDASQRGIGGGMSLPKTLYVVFSLTALCFMLQRCGPAREEMERREAAAALSDSVSSYMPGIATQTVDGIGHNFVRTADIKCKMEDVLASTRQIESLLTANGGYVAKSDLVSVIDQQHNVQFKKDSMAEFTAYTISNAMVLRVPSRQLDTLVSVLTGMAVFVDHRRLSSDDVKMQLFANALAGKRLNRYTKTLEKKSETKAAALKETVAAEETLLNRQAQADEKRMESYGLAGQVNYSTVTLEIYQARQEKIRVLPAPLNVSPYEPGFASKLGEAFSNGFDLLKSCLLFLINSWGFFLILGLAILGVRKAFRYGKRAGTV